MDAPINFGLKNAAGGVGDTAGLRGPLDQSMTADVDAAMAQESGKVCRICLDEEEDFQSGNPFITPCRCMGSMKYIHLKCLRNWTDSKK